MVGREKQKVVIDTSGLMSIDTIKNYVDEYSWIINTKTLEELDNLAKSENHDRAYKSRKALRWLDENDDIFTYVVNDVPLSEIWAGNIGWDFNKPDNLILDVALREGAMIYTGDKCMRVKARSLDIPVLVLNDKQDEYTGYREVSLTEQEIDSILQDGYFNRFNLYPNEYLIINNTTIDDQFLMMWNGEYFEEVKTKSIKNKYTDISPKDVYQKLFIHMLQNSRALFKITDSPLGCGKSFLMIHWALQMIEKEKFNKLYFIKADTPPLGTKPFPAIPGDVNEKCEPLLGVLKDSTQEKSVTDILLRNDKLEILPIQFARGRNLSNSIMIINEAQNFTPPQMELMLGRLADNSVALIDGSNQQIDNPKCFSRSGLTACIENFISDEEASQVNLVNDYRGKISRLVARKNWR